HPVLSSMGATTLSSCGMSRIGLFCESYPVKTFLGHSTPSIFRPMTRCSPLLAKEFPQCGMFPMAVSFALLPPVGLLDFLQTERFWSSAQILFAFIALRTGCRSLAYQIRTKLSPLHPTVITWLRQDPG